MNKNIDDGGPAFPRTGADGHTSPQSGMSLRDFFAAAALKVILEDPKTRIPQDYAALNAYYIADAMIKVRKA